MSRTLEDIQRDYQQTALQLGAEAYKLHALAVEAEKAEQVSTRLKNKMVGLNKEASKLQERTPTGEDDPKFPPPNQPVESEEEVPSEQS